eukprot:985763-Prymnesium_polylepis.3
MSCSCSCTVRREEGATCGDGSFDRSAARDGRGGRVWCNASDITRVTSLVIRDLQAGEPAGCATMQGLSPMTNTCV